MRSRKEIQEEYEDEYKGNAPLTADLKQVFELLLDIRELLKELTHHSQQNLERKPKLVNERTLSADAKSTNKVSK